MKLKSLILFSFFILFSCEDVENNRRLLVQGNFISDSITPVSDVEVFTTFANNTSISSTSNFIGQGFSDDDGKFQLTSLVPKEQNMNLVLNRNFFVNQQGNSINSPYILFEIERELFQDIDKISLDDFYIPVRSSLDVNITKTSTENAELIWSLTYNEFICEQYIDDPLDLRNLSFCEQTNTTGFINNDQNPSFSRNITTVTNTNAVFLYSLNGQSEEQILIPINNPSTTFEFEY
jgi:hypothetical protein